MNVTAIIDSSTQHMLPGSLRVVSSYSDRTVDAAKSEGTGIPVVRSARCRMESLAFYGARIPYRNCAGIRVESERIEIRNCHFEDNQNGILTATFAGIDLDVSESAFVVNSAGEGHTHNFYGGHFTRLVVQGYAFLRANFADSCFRVGRFARASRTPLVATKTATRATNSSFRMAARRR